MAVKYSSVTSALGKRFTAACRKLGISKAEACRRIGWKFYADLANVLSGSPGRAGKKRLGMVEKFIDEAMR